MRRVLSDGVGCGSCHGPAHTWRSTHYLPGQRGKRDAEKGIAAPRDTRALPVRTETCVRCHVGHGDADVNHDLIAAGHPRLRFEFGAYHANMAKHWDQFKKGTRKEEQGEKVAFPDFEARAWALGQIVSAKAALELLAHRASGAEKKRKPWPEFAEYTCSACHHDLRDQGWQQKEGSGRQRARLFPWGTWYRWMLSEVPQRDETTLDGLKELAKQMGHPYPNPKAVSEEARDVAGRMALWLGQVEKSRFLNAASIRDLLRSVARDERQLVEGDWDGATQTYLTLTALYHGMTDMDKSLRSPRLKKSILEMGASLQFSEGSNTPGRFDSGLLRQRLGIVREQLGR